jgi:hypothetical protein
MNHPIRGFAVSLIFVPLMLVSAANALAALAATFIGGWLPSEWFSDNPVDWLFAFGQINGAANYFAFMASALVASGCWWVLRWAFTGSTGN